MGQMTINDIQDEIIDEFGVLDGDMEMTIGYLMEIGERLPAFEEGDKLEQNEIKGCQSKVWMTTREEDGQVYFNADSNTAITKGLVSLLVRILDGQAPDDIIAADLYFKDRIGMSRFIGTQRSNGFGAMIKQMKHYAIAYKAKLTGKV